MIAPGGCLGPKGGHLRSEQVRFSRASVRKRSCCCGMLATFDGSTSSSRRLLRAALSERLALHLLLGEPCVASPPWSKPSYRSTGAPPRTGPAQHTCLRLMLAASSGSMSSSRRHVGAISSTSSSSSSSSASLWLPPLRESDRAYTMFPVYITLAATTAAKRQQRVSWRQGLPRTQPHQSSAGAHRQSVRRDLKISS